MDGKIFFSLILGIVQGVAEWLPLSSKTIIMIILIILGANAAIAYDLAISLHIGTLIAALTVYGPMIIRDIAKNKFKSVQARFISLASLSTALTGLPLYFFVHKLLSIDVASSRYVTMALNLLFIATAIILLKTRFKGDRDMKEVSLRDSFIIGIAQGFSAVPGVSRSGITIFSAALLGFNASASLDLSFMLSMLSIPAAVFISLAFGGEPVTVWFFNINGAVAAISAALTGVVAIKVLRRIAVNLASSKLILLLSIIAVILGLASLLPCLTFYLFDSIISM